MKTPMVALLAAALLTAVAAFARRSRDAWFVAVLNGPDAKTIQVPLSFPRDTRYVAMLVRARKDEPAAVEIEEITVQRTDSLRVELSQGGGFIGRFQGN